MSILASVHHLTHYKYDRVASGRASSRLRRRRTVGQQRGIASLQISPKEHFVNYQQRSYGNWLARYVISPIR